MTTDIIYRYKNQVYFNITNKCPCRCTFCIRNTEDDADARSASGIQRMPSVRRPISGLIMNRNWKKFIKPLMSLISQIVMKWFSVDTESRQWPLRT